ncbi:hypothetical protein [Streptococcus parauberis]|uniref:Phage membrane protein n=1 Tax=Streptococcus parauberis NCFD 2020 TaxID=873447 RepID=F1YY67_9STRE|nr:hypothetical protein [Streptococcus parauberis]EGE55067.1 hypothetical protein SPB_1468 [Streptococcus parauberis NCFD 2020]QBX09985.1 hypothetical protein JavanS402_0007 [Streptococcus satellite phage Javan402]
MINELNLTPMQYLATLLALLLLMVILSHFKSYIAIDLPDIKSEPKPTGDPLYGAYLQSQGKYYN